jgi:hypothetical protein
MIAIRNIHIALAKLDLQIGPAAHKMRFPPISSRRSESRVVSGICYNPRPEATHGHNRAVEG